MELPIKITKNQGMYLLECAIPGCDEVFGLRNPMQVAANGSQLRKIVAHVQTEHPKYGSFDQ